VLEAETGFREGHPARALPGEPRPAYDPDRTTLTQRRYAKAAETEAMPRPEAVRLGLQRLSLQPPDEPVIPADPPAVGKKTLQAKRPRNTVFDDHGPADATGS
jgi:hypothetical protein